MPSMEVGKRLVSPDLRLYIVADPAALRDLVKALELGWVLGGNLQQLCGWAEVGADRIDRKETGSSMNRPVFDIYGMETVQRASPTWSSLTCR